MKVLRERQNLRAPVIDRGRRRWSREGSCKNPNFCGVCKISRFTGDFGLQNSCRSSFFCNDFRDSQDYEHRHDLLYRGSEIALSRERTAQQLCFDVTRGHEDLVHAATDRDFLDAISTMSYKSRFLASVTCRYSAKTNKTMTMSKTVTISKNKEY